METGRLYALPKLPYGYSQLAPYISEEQLTIHHQKHHQAYVNGANAILQKLDKARKEGTDLDVKPTLKELSWNIGGHLLHSLFWENLALPVKGGGKPGGTVADVLEKEFGSFDRLKKARALKLERNCVRTPESLGARGLKPEGSGERCQVRYDFCRSVGSIPDALIQRPNASKWNMNL